MRVVIQRVNQAEVRINDGIVRNIDKGLVILIGAARDDTQDDVIYLVNKIPKLRIFKDENGKMNRSVQDEKGEVLVVSQFTLFADTRKGLRPSFNFAALPNEARVLYNSFIQGLEKQLPDKVVTGEFGASMQVSLVNDGPVTLIMDSRNHIADKSSSTLMGEGSSFSP